MLFDVLLFDVDDLGDRLVGGEHFPGRTELMGRHQYPELLPSFYVLAPLMYLVVLMLRHTSVLQYTQSAVT